jgi:lipoprotein-anchoring transpeptidase ErfK/SrfK
MPVTVEASRGNRFPLHSKQREFFMSVWKAKVGGVLSAVVAVAALAGVPSTANAQGLIEFLWGGEPEYGGQKRQLVGFDSKYTAGQIIVSFGDRRLYHITKAGQAMSYPIAVPREQSRWEGNTVVSQKRENPDWRPTPDMLKENPKLPSWVPGGHPMNPLGVRALYLGSSLYRIHGTDAPWTIGQDVSKGCIRMFNEDVIHLYPKVPTGTKVVVTWQRFKTGAAIADAGESPATSSAQQDVLKAKTRSVANAPKAGFFVGPDEGNSNPGPQGDLAADEGLEQDEEATTYSLQPDGTYAVEETTSQKVKDEVVPRPQEGMVNKQRYGRKVGAGAVSRSAQASVQ